MDTGRPQASAHAILEHIRLIKAREHAELIRANPDLIAQAQSYLKEQSWARSPSSGQLLWHDLLLQDVETISAEMISDTPSGQLLRSDSPFHVIVDDTNEADRKAMWRRAKAELETAAS